MSQRGRWLVLCPVERALSLAEVLEKVEMPDGARPRLEGDVLVLAVDSGDGEELEVHVTLATGPVVLDEAVEFAEEYGAGRDDKDRIATYGARYELSWVLAESEYVFETYYTMAFELTDATGGITLDLVEERFVEA